DDRLHAGIVAGMNSEWVAGFASEWMAGIIGIRNPQDGDVRMARRRRRGSRRTNGEQQRPHQ
ncbi:hypothetical protein, partial [Rhizobium rhizogenes]|uniref:hypothetical protein n=1 Tax=Rhizobium rhizogenes TaxID=359 RepID=UPI001AEEC190